MTVPGVPPPPPQPSPSGPPDPVSDSDIAPSAGAGALPEADASLYLHPQTLARVGSFELRAKMIVEGISSGQHRSPYHGFSIEFAQHRPYVAGDDLRHLDWKVYARTDKLHLKQYQQETNLDLLVMVDASGSMSYGSGSFDGASAPARATDAPAPWSKFDHAAAVAAAIAFITLRQGDRVGLCIFAEQVRALLRKSGGQRAWRQLVGALANHPLTPDNRRRPTSLQRAVDQVLSQAPNRSLVAIVSDFFIDLPDLRQSLARLRYAGHDVMAFQVLDRAEETFPFTDAAPFEGLEGEAALRIDPRGLRDAYLRAFSAHVNAVESLVRSPGFDYQRLSTHARLGPPLAAFIARRNAAIKRSKFA